MNSSMVYIKNDDDVKRLMPSEYIDLDIDISKHDIHSNTIKIDLITKIHILLFLFIFILFLIALFFVNRNIKIFGFGALALVFILLVFYTIT